jgi:hypothetical protein
MLYAAQVIPKIDPREIGSAFHRAGAEIAEKGHFCMETILHSAIALLFFQDRTLPQR